MEFRVPGSDIAKTLVSAPMVLTRGLVNAYDRAVAGAGAVLGSHSVPVGQSPKDAAWALNKARLYHYRPVPQGESLSQAHRTPLLLVYALINKPFIFDLAPDRSFIQHLLRHGYDVYLLDWGTPGPEDVNTRFDDYVSEYLTRAVRALLRDCGQSEVSILGYCLGATITAAYAATYREAPLRNLILLTPPLDFAGTTEGSMAMWIERDRMDVDRLVDSLGNIPGELIREWAKLIKPMENYVGSYAGMLRLVHDEAAVRSWQAINRWVEDVVPVAGEAFRQFVKDYVWNNALMTGRHRIGDRRVDLANIRANLLAISAKYDHLVIPSQSEGIMSLVSSEDKTYRIIPSTHVGIMAGHGAKEKLWPEVVAWLAERSD